jgi:hypothetical protein
MNFLEKRIQQELDKLSTEKLKATINQGLDDMMEMVTKKPEGWELEIENYERTFRVLKREIERREGHKNEDSP